MKKSIRNYQGSDGYMLETSSALRVLFVENLPAFTSFDSTLDATFATDWLAKIEAAATVVHHTQVKDISAQKTDDVLELMEKCRLKYNEVKFFAIKAFKNSESKQAEFGTDTYASARARNVSMVAFMDEMHKACQKYLTQLLAAGMSQVSIDEIPLLRDALFAANTEQESYQRATPVLTQERIAVLNQCYDATRLVIDAAMVVYYNDYARRNMFVYLPHTGDKKDIEFVKQAVLDETPIHIYTVAYSEERQFVLYNNGPSRVAFYLSDDASIISSAVEVVAGERITVKSPQLGTEGSHLFVVLKDNNNTTADVEVEISLE